MGMNSRFFPAFFSTFSTVLSVFVLASLWVGTAVSNGELEKEAAHFYQLPTGTALQVILFDRIHTAENMPGDSITAAVSQNIYLGRDLILSKNARLIGRISRLESPIQGRNAILKVEFTGLKTEDDGHFSMAAEVDTDKPGNIFGGELTPGTKVRKVTHRVYGIGQYNQARLSGPRAMGHHLEFLPGEIWTVILTTPLRLTQQ